MRFRSLTAVMMATLLVMGCTSYKITQPLSDPLDRSADCVIGAIADRLPTDLEAEDRPPLNDLTEFSTYLQEALLKKEIFGSVSTMGADPTYEVTGAILGYRRGSGALRFLIGFGAGNAEITVELSLVERATGAILFSGNFKRTVSSGLESGIEMYKRVAKDFAGALEKQLRNQTPSNSSDSDDTSG